MLTLFRRKQMSQNVVPSTKAVRKAIATHTASVKTLKAMLVAIKGALNSRKANRVARGMRKTQILTFLATGPQYLSDIAKNLQIPMPQASSALQVLIRENKVTKLGRGQYQIVAPATVDAVTAV
jgi:predicted transcriptional regulator